MRKIAIVISHPIQYYAPVFQLLSQQQKIQVKVFYTWGEASLKKFDPGFKKVIEWDLPLLQGYDYTFLKNTAADPGTHHFWGIKNSDAIQQITEFRPDALLVYGWSWHSHLKIIHHFSGRVPLWFRGDSHSLSERWLLKKIARQIFLKWVYGKVQKAFYVGSANRNYFRSLSLKQHQLVFAPHAIDNNRFAHANPEEVAAFRSRIGVPEHATMVLFAGKLEPVKNPMLLLEAFLSCNLKNCYLTFVGNGALEEALKSKVQQLSKEENVKFINFLNQRDIVAAYHACDLFCLPSYSESWGLAVNEAMAAGKAVLVSDRVGCASDLVKDGINGRQFKSDDVVDLSNCLTQLLSDATRLKEMGVASTKIIQPWSFKSQVEAITKQLIS